MTTYPLRMEAELQPGLSRWLWLVKWFLAIPHFIVLAFLWIAFVVLSVVAFVAIVITGRYPASLFAFNVGVLRWTWRVSYYSFGANGTDRYPPFTLAEVPDYPTHLEVAYPQRLSRGLVFVKWLLALPHLVIVAILAGGGSFVAWNVGRADVGVWTNLIGVLVLVAVVTLLFTGTYPRALFDLILGLNRWVLRVGAYVGLMTDAYPPFRLDMGGSEPEGTLSIPPPPAPTGTEVAPGRRGWTGGRITAVVIGSFVALAAVGMLAAGGVGVWADRTQRDAAGYVTSSTGRLTTETYAITSDRMELWLDDPAWFGVRETLGTVRIRVVPAEGSGPAFVGIGPTEEVSRYLDGVGRAVVEDLRDVGFARTYEGTAPTTAPAAQGFWVASSEGEGTRTIVWDPEPGTWTVVAMNADAGGGLDLRAEVGATVPALPWIAAGLLIAGVVLLAVGAVLIAVPVARASRS